MTAANKELARAFFAGLTAGELPEAILAPDFAAWTTTRGDTPGAAYSAGVKMFGTLFPDRLNYTVISLTAEEDRVAAEIRADGVLVNGEAYGNTYIFMLKIKNGRIASVAEHFNPQPVAEKIMPIIQARMTR